MFMLGVLGDSAARARAWRVGVRVGGPKNGSAQHSTPVVQAAAQTPKSKISRRPSKMRMEP